MVRLEGSSKAQNFIQQYSGRITPVDKKLNKKKKKTVKEKVKMPSQPAPKSSPEADNFSITPLHSETSRGKLVMSMKILIMITVKTIGITISIQFTVWK